MMVQEYQHSCGTFGTRRAAASVAGGSRRCFRRTPSRLTQSRLPTASFWTCSPG